MNTYTEINNLRLSLASVMEVHKLTQQNICDRTGVTQSAISLFLNGHRGLSGDSALKLMKFIHKGIERKLSYAPLPTRYPQDEQSN